MPRFLAPILGLAAALSCGAASAVDVAVLARDNCACDSTIGAVAGPLQAGQAFTVDVSPTDLWSAGELPRFSNANGLVGDLFATGTDESGQAVGTLIGQNFGQLGSTSSFSAPYGALVGQIGNSGYFLIGTHYSGTASTSGVLSLYFWDSSSADNTGSVLASVNVSAVPEPSTYGLLAGGLGVLAWVARRRRV